jgi:hypothetical protein
LVGLHVITCRTLDEQERDVPIAALPAKLQEAFELGRRLSRAELSASKRIYRDDSRLNGA